MHGTRIGLSVALAAGLVLAAAIPLSAVGQSAVPGASVPASMGPDATAWGGLVWSAPTPGPDGYVQVVIPFGSSLVAVGSVNGEDRTSAAAWRSSDGVSWERTLLDGEPSGEAQMRWVVRTPSGLLAVGWAGVQHCTGEGEGGVRCTRVPVAMWTSVDGATWTREPEQTVFNSADVTSVASGPNGLVAVGDRGFDHPRLWTSIDGTSWQAQHLPPDVFSKAHFMDIASTPGGWVIVGASGGTPPTGSALSDGNGSLGAAWLSADGLTWTRAHVAGRGPQVELRSVYLGADGLVALGTREGGQVGTVWTSTVGKRWDLAPSAPDGMYLTFPKAADGQRIIGDSYVDGDRTSFSVSGDGITWRPLANLGATATMPRSPGASGAAFVDSAFMLPDGVLFLGMGNDGATIAWRTTPVPVDALPQSSPSPSASPH